MNLDNHLYNEFSGGGGFRREHNNLIRDIDSQGHHILGFIISRFERKDQGYSYSNDGPLGVWDLNSGERVTLESPKDKRGRIVSFFDISEYSEYGSRDLYGVGFTGDGAKVYGFGGKDGGFYLWDAKTGALERSRNQWQSYCPN